MPKSLKILFLFIPSLLIYLSFFIDDIFKLTVYNVDISGGYFYRCGFPFMGLALTIPFFTHYLFAKYSRTTATHIYALILAILCTYMLMSKRSGLVDYGWITGIAAVSVATFFFLHQTLPNLESELKLAKGLPGGSDCISVITIIHDDIKWLITKVLQAILSLGAITGVAMTILFQDGFAGISEKAQGIKMVFNFIFILIIAGAFIVSPLVSMMRQSRLALTNSHHGNSRS